MPKPKIRVAIISAGRMASSIDDEIRGSDTWPSLKQQLPYSHAPCYRQFEEVEICAVSDLIEEKCKTFCERWDVPKYYLDYREMIETEKPQIVSIATPAGTHAEMAVFAMDHGVRGIYCEKAMCCSLSEADAIVESAARNGAKFMLGAQRRHHPHFKKAREIVESGQIGDLINVTSWVASSLLHSLSHCVDGSLFLAGDRIATSVFGVLGEVHTIDILEKRRIAQLPQFDPADHRWNGDPGCITYTAHLLEDVYLFHLSSVSDVRWEVVCTNGYLRILNNNDSLEVYRRRAATYSFDRVPVETIPPASPHLALVADLISCVHEGGTPLANERAARNGMEILMGAAESHRRGGQTVPLPLESRAMYIPSH